MCNLVLSNGILKLLFSYKCFHIESTSTLKKITLKNLNHSLNFTVELLVSSKNLTAYVIKFIFKR